MHINNIHEAIRSGKWDYEPDDVDDSHFDSTSAMPGTDEKLEILAARARKGLPLWNSNDRTDYDESQVDEFEDDELL